MAEFVIIFCTVPDPAMATKISTSLVEKKLAACCNTIAGITSVYRWQGKIENEREQLLIIKSTEEKYKQIEDEIRSLHSYQVPEIICMPVTQGNPAYLNWIVNCLED